MSPEDLQAVVEDLEHLRDDWGPGLTDPQARRGSAVLRRLLVEGVYGQAWRNAGFTKEPKVVAVTIESHIGHLLPSEVIMAMAGGVRFAGIDFGGAFFAKSSKQQLKPSEPLTPDGFPGEREYPLSGYLASTAALAQGRVATRRDIIKYYANVKGGVHLGRKERKREAKLIRRMEKFERKFTFVGWGNANPLLEREGLLVELICIAQAVGRSPDTIAFLETARKTLQSVAVEDDGTR